MNYIRIIFSLLLVFTLACTGEMDTPIISNFDDLPCDNTVENFSCKTTTIDFDEEPFLSDDLIGETDYGLEYKIYKDEIVKFPCGSERPEFWDGPWKGVDPGRWGFKFEIYTTNPKYKPLVHMEIHTDIIDHFYFPATSEGKYDSKSGMWSGFMWFPRKFNGRGEHFIDLDPMCIIPKECPEGTEFVIFEHTFITPGEDPWNKYSNGFDAIFIDNTNVWSRSKPYKSDPCRRISIW